MPYVLSAEFINTGRNIGIESGNEDFWVLFNDEHFVMSIFYEATMGCLRRGVR